MLDIHILISTIISGLAFLAGLAGGYIIMHIWPKTTDEFLYVFVGITTIVFIFIGAWLFFFLKKKLGLEIYCTDKTDKQT